MREAALPSTELGPVLFCALRPLAERCLVDVTNLRYQADIDLLDHQACNLLICRQR